MSSVNITPGSSAATPSSSRGRIYRTGNDTRWATREIAALDFLLSVPLEAERQIVKEGLLVTSKMNHFDSSEHDTLTNQTTEPAKLNTVTTNGNNIKTQTAARWWDKLILMDRTFFSAENRRAARRARLELEEKELDNPTVELPLQEDGNFITNELNSNRKASPESTSLTQQIVTASFNAPGRRLEGLEAVAVTPPKGLPRLKLSVEASQQKAVTRFANVRDWEKEVAFGPVTKGKDCNGGLLDGRAFFSQNGGYPLSVFSVIKYEKAREAAYKRRREIEQQGRGGSQFFAPHRDWRGISYSQLLHKDRSNRKHDFLKNGTNLDDDNSDDSSMNSTSTNDSDYEPGFLDDPTMVQGKHRHVIQGDRIIGPVVSSMILFVKPANLKADLNKQFRERFDGWEPSKSRRMLIGAQVIDGVYTLMDPTEEEIGSIDDDDVEDNGKRKGSIASDIEVIRMPPSLTLSKIRNIKQQALIACVKANIEVSTVALACVYFERLCLDCRVDKSNRRLSFATCLLLAYKLNEPHVAIVNNQEEGESKRWIYSFAKRTTKSSNIFALMLDFFTQEWELSLKNLYASEWGVFVALGFHLHVRPSQVAFHFKRMMKKLERTPLAYLGSTCHRQWQESLNNEIERKQLRAERHEFQLKRRERKILDLQLKLQRQANNHQSDIDYDSNMDADIENQNGKEHQRSTITWNELTNNQTVKIRKSSSVGSGISLWGKIKRTASMGKNMDKLPHTTTQLANNPKIEPTGNKIALDFIIKQNETNMHRPITDSVISTRKSAELMDLPDWRSSANEINLESTSDIEKLTHGEVADDAALMV